MFSPFMLPHRNQKREGLFGIDVGSPCPASPHSPEISNPLIQSYPSNTKLLLQTGLPSHLLGFFLYSHQNLY